MEGFGEIGVVGIFVILLIKQIGELVAKVRGTGDKQQGVGSEKYDALFKITRESQRMLNDLHEWHGGPNARDNLGGFKWYGHVNMPESMDKLATALAELSETMRELHRDNQEIKRGLADINK